jgi:hypothetical protein
LTFLEKNRYFLQSEFYSGLKGKVGIDRNSYYLENLQLESLSRMREYLNIVLKNEIEKTLNNFQNDIFQSKDIELRLKSEAYSSIIDLFGEFECERILSSIYFDSLAYELIEELSLKLIQHKPKNTQDEFGLWYLLESNIQNKDHQGLRSFFLHIFQKELNLSLSEMREIGSNKYFTRKYNDWLNQKLREVDTERKIIVMTFHYTKHWSIYHDKPFDTPAAILLYSILASNLHQDVENIKINFISIVDDIKILFDSLLITTPKMPIILSDESISSIEPQPSKGFFIALDKYRSALIDHSYFFKGYMNWSYKELIELFYKSEGLNMEVLANTILSKLDAGTQFRENDIQIFIDHYTFQTKDVHRMNLEKKLIRKFYLYYLE